MNRSPHFPISLFALAIALLATFLSGATAVRGQAGDAQETSPVFGEVLEVEVVNVEVFVTGKDGEPVVDLGPEDFEVFEDGQPIVLTNFRKVRDGKVIRDGDPSSDATVPTAAPIAEEETPPRLPDRRTTEAAGDPLHLVLYVDNAFIRSTNRHRVLRDLRQLARSVDPSTRILVASNSRALKINQPFTSDTSAVTDALLELETKAVFGNDSQNQFLDLLREIEGDSIPRHIVEAHVRSYAQQTRQLVDQGLRAIRETVESLAGLPGRKAFVYASDGLPLTPAEELFNAMQLRYNDLSTLRSIMEFNASRDFQLVAQQANTADVSFYTIHAAGIEAPLGSSAELSGSGIDELRPTVDSVRTANFQGSGRLLADETGGLALLNTNDFSAGLGRMLRDFETHYSLGYHPRHGRDERYHQIEVKVKRPGVKVRHRRGYRDRSLSHRLKDSVLASLQHGLEDNRFGVTIRAGTPRPHGEARNDTTLVQPFSVEIPMGPLVFLPNAESHEGRVKLYISVLDPRRQTSPPQEISIPMTIPNEAIDRARTQSWKQEVELLVRQGEGQLAVGVWDEIGRTWSVLRRSFRAEPPKNPN